MATFAGTVTLVLLLETETVAPLLGAGAARVTVQAEEPGASTLAGLQESALSEGWIVAVPPTLAAGICDPFEPTETGFVSPTVADPLAAETTVIVTFATTPLAIALSCVP